MKTVAKRVLLLVSRFGAVWLLALACHSAIAQQGDAVWQELQPQAARTAELAAKRPMPNDYRALKINLNALAGLARSPAAQEGGNGLPLTLPHPDGDSYTYIVWRSTLLAPQLSEQFPNIQTLAGHRIDNPSESIVINISPRGFAAQILSPEGRWMIDPLSRSDPSVSISYRSEQVSSRHGESQCLVTGNSATKLPDEEKKSTTATLARDIKRTAGSQLKTYRLAVATTGEYTEYHGGTVGDGLAAVATTINRVNQIYNSELSVNLQLVGSNNLLIETDKDNDPFSNTSNDLGSITPYINGKIGAGSYDVGHLMGTGGGGVAYLGVICGSLKGDGLTGSSSPVGDSFDVDYVAHELGHQFSGNHSFNGAIGNCVNRNGPTAFEPGSGSTIQAYAGICGADNLQSNSDPIFHSISFDEMRAHIESGSGSQCGTLTSTGNTPPTVDAGNDYTVPANTPLVVSGSATDAEQQNLTYLWEQRDLGSQAQLNAADDGSIPLFRVFAPTTSPSRYLPKLSSVVSGSLSDSEKIPKISRNMNFRLTVRDGVGGVNSDDIVIAVDGGSGPFVLTTPNGGETIGNTATVTWNPAGTAGAPVNASQVEFWLSINGGASFDIGPFGATANDGSETISMPPNINTTAARLMVKGKNNIFYDISNANFSLTTGSAETPQDPVFWSTAAGNSSASIFFKESIDPSANSYRATCTPVSGQSQNVNESALPNISIPDNNTTGVTSVITIEDDIDLDGSNLQIGVDISHTYRGDVSLTLTSPRGTAARLKVEDYGDSGDNVTGTYPITLLPVDQLSVFNGESSKGIWTLRAADVFSGDIGTLKSWSIAISGESLAGVEAEAQGSPIFLPGMTNDVLYECSLVALNSTLQSAVIQAGTVIPTAAAQPNAPTIDSISSAPGTGVATVFVSASGAVAPNGYRVVCNDRVKESSTNSVTFTGLTDGESLSCVAISLSSNGGSIPSATTDFIVGSGEEEDLQGLPIWLLYEATK